MKLSDTGLALVKSSEGFSAAVYKDAAGFDTIGYGHLLKPGESFPHGITASQATDMLEADLAIAEKAVNAVIPTDCTQGQYDALVDFCFNLGAGALRKMLSHGWSDVPNQMPYWNHAGGVVVAGLTTRRAAEVALFNS
jgi:lysozyme